MMSKIEDPFHEVKKLGCIDVNLNQIEAFKMAGLGEREARAEPSWSLQPVIA